MSYPPLSFTSGEVGNYYEARVPTLKRRGGGEWRGPCPIHNGDGNSFTVNPSTGLWICHSECRRGGDILALEQELNGGDFATCKAETFRVVGRHNGTTNGNAGIAATNGGSWKEIARYPYVDEGGAVLYEVIRYLKPDGQKSFEQGRRGDGDEWIKNLDGVSRVPYRLPEVLQAETVYLVEGEKDVATLEAFGLVASCNSGGSGSSRLYAGWGDFFRGRHLVVVPDNDGPGRKHAAAVAAALLPSATSVRILELPGLLPKGDITDWQQAGGTREQLEELAAATAPLDAAALATFKTPSDWPQPEPLEGELPSVVAFDEELLPESFRPWARDMADRMQVPIDYPAVIMMLCLAGAVSRRATIQPKANDSHWLVVPNLWGGIVAPPGYLKSPVIAAATQPLLQIQTEWQREHEADVQAYAGLKEEHELRHSAWKEQYKASAKKSGTAPERPDGEPAEPKRRRLIVNDSTPEALHRTMSENPAGILVIRDELTGWWSQLDQPGREGERSFCLSAWNGNTGHTLDRIGRGTIHAEACCMSLLGGIQPGRLRSYMVDALEDGPANDGLIQRFQLLVYPDTKPAFVYVDRAPDERSEQLAAAIFRKLVALDPENPMRLRFSPEAQALFVEWYRDIHGRIRGEELHPALISHLGKYGKTMPSIAALLALAEWAAGTEGTCVVTLRHANQAAEWCTYLESHANRVYSCVVAPQVRAARDLAAKIKARKVGKGGFLTAREVYGKGWSGLDTPQAVKQAAEVLQDAGWLRAASGESSDSLGRGRPANRYEVNPRIWP